MCCTSAIIEGHGSEWSIVGTDTKSNPEMPSIMLNLKGLPPEIQESVVIHQFGHALGLEHEHQRSDFWDVLEKYVDIDKMKKDVPSYSKRGSHIVMQNWFRKTDNPGEQSVNSLSEYDPESIMHYA